MDFFDGFDTSITGQLEALAFKHFGADYGEHSSIWDKDDEMIGALGIEQLSKKQYK